MKKKLLTIALGGSLACLGTLSALGIKDSQNLAQAKDGHEASHTLIEHAFEWKDPTQEGFRPYYMCKECCLPDPNFARYSYGNKTQLTSLGALRLSPLEKIDANEIVDDEIANVDTANFKYVDQGAKGASGKGGESTPVYVKDDNHKAIYFSRSGITGEGDDRVAEFHFDTEAKDVKTVSFSYRYENWGTLTASESIEYRVLCQFVSESSGTSLNEGLALDEALVGDGAWHTLTINYSDIVSSETVRNDFTGLIFKFADLRGYFMISDLKYAVGESEAKRDARLGIEPLVAEDGESLTYGLYPQKRVTDANVITELNALQSAQSNGWYLLNDEYYAKLTAAPYSTSYKFDDGTLIEKNVTYWFKCEPIKWRIVSSSSDSYTLIADCLLDTHVYNSNTSNSYYTSSTLHSWLNGTFCSHAFGLNSSKLKAMSFEMESRESDGSIYHTSHYANNVKVRSPSYGNCQSYFSDSADRITATTDYCRASGANQNGTANYGRYWTLSTMTSVYSAGVEGAWTVGTSGSFGTAIINTTGICARPMIFISK